MVVNAVKYALVGYVVVKSGQFVYRKVSEWRNNDTQ